ncbi:isoleucyl-tRNA synthetase [Pokkaliibacter plantistimulans]|uniref:Isoleucyl-tRNA synthetase n=2 Tax=Pokkaliibacter plantistimulans TaxID=1635171 RepID=A0ABX5M271_9GAMM|nr:isoleucyl-tRNA synthetase [Pokkaliibacter plantistimulans]
MDAVMDHPDLATASSGLPDIVAGPLLRRAEANRLVFWLVSTCPLHWQLKLSVGDGAEQAGQRPAGTSQALQVGLRCWIHLLDFQLEQPLPDDQPVSYDLQYQHADQPEADWLGIRQWAPELCYDNEALPRILVRQQLTQLLHGSCRKPHFPAGDGLVRADQWLAEHRQQNDHWPSLMMLSGDQIYADDVAGPMLVAIHQVMALLGLWPEQLQGARVSNTAELLGSEHCYYDRQHLLPDTALAEEVRRRFFRGVRKPIFTSDSAHNHLITFAEVVAMYCLVWSPLLWRQLQLACPARLTAEARQCFEREREHIEAFAGGLTAVRRVLAHLPSYMIFDDHDVTDDWNLNAEWEEAAYGNAFSRRIIGNALLGYLLCQGWGNQPERFAAVMPELQQWLLQAQQGEAAQRHDELITHLLGSRYWHYALATEPALVVLDTRTQRWRSERSLARPSGLMDWEALVELQQTLMDRQAVVLVSPAPVFGVKLIEAIQRLFTWFGKPLMVDAENWMAHPGAANVMLNIFRHPRTPQHFVILSGDVHYSFVYDIHLRFRRQGPTIWQITSSGLKNEFPHRLLDSFDRLNRWLYAPWSPLNWLTKRRRMRVHPRRPQQASRGERLINGAGMGYVRLDPAGEPLEVVQLMVDGRKLAFEVHEGEEEHWA